MFWLSALDTVPLSGNFYSQLCNDNGRSKWIFKYQLSANYNVTLAWLVTNPVVSSSSNRSADRSLIAFLRTDRNRFGWMVAATRNSIQLVIEAHSPLSYDNVWVLVILIKLLSDNLFMAYSNQDAH